MAKEVVMVDIDDLAVDARNIREGKWERDEEFVQDIKENGILNPLTVRSAEPDSDVKYAIVCGSQRYNAAIEAGLSEVPCLIEELDDVTALGRTMAENRYQGELPAWRYAKKIGEMYDELDGKGNKDEIVKIISSKTGFAETTIYAYIDINRYLPKEALELMKKPEERSESVTELVKKTLMIKEDSLLSIEKAWKIVRELKDEPKERMVEAAIAVLPLTKERAFQVIERAKVYPKDSMMDIVEKVMEIPRGGLKRMIEFGAQIARALDAATVQKQRDLKELVLYYVEEGLKRDGFL